MSPLAIVARIDEPEERRKASERRKHARRGPFRSMSPNVAPIKRVDARPSRLGFSYPPLANFLVAEEQRPRSALADSAAIVGELERLSTEREVGTLAMLR